MIIPPIAVSNYAQLLAAESVLAEIKPYRPVDADTGFETWFEGSGVFVCQDNVTWSQVWDRHIKNESIGNVKVGNLNPAPAVDFNKNLVVALFAGPTKGVVGYRVVGGFSFGKEAVLRLAIVRSNSSASAIALPTPWAFLVLPRTNANVSIQIPQGDQWATIGKVKPSL